MATVRDILERAYRKIGVVPEDEEMTADQAANACDALNMMMHGWELFGVNVLHADLTVQDTFPLPDRFQEGTVYQLAERISPDNSRPAPDSDVFLRALQAAYLDIGTVEMPASMTYRNRNGVWR